MVAGMCARMNTGKKLQTFTSSISLAKLGAFFPASGCLECQLSVDLEPALVP
jgi:hypothetical protein